MTEESPHYIRWTTVSLVLLILMGVAPFVVGCIVTRNR